MAIATLTILPLICLCTIAYTLENLALGKEAQMSSQRSDDGAEAAVDGNTTQTESSGTCALTDLRGQEAWWSVDLNGTFAISQLTIYLLNTYIFRFRYYSVHVTDDLDNWKSSVPCAKNDNAAGAQTSVVDVNCDAKGSHVTIWLNRPNKCNPSDNDNYCDILQLCEVKVLGCQPGNYSHNCNMTCPVNCRDDICAIDNGKCYSCKNGYLGDYCDQENLALGMEAQMSSQRSVAGADAAVDGNTAQTESSGTCALTDLRGQEAWWSVDLNGTFAITQLTIYLLNTNVFRFRYYSVHVTDDLYNWKSSVPCARNDNAGGAQTSVVQVNCDAKGRHVTIWLKRYIECRPSDHDNFCDILQLCEVQVLGCQPGYYSQNCNMTCPANCRDDICAIDNGKCYSCKDGYLGDNCDHACQPGKFGQECKSTCNGFCRNGTTCSNVNGFCPEGCMTGYDGNYCNKTCSNRTFGFECKGNCGYCVNNELCHHTTGVCDNGCDNGWTGTYCNISCDAGKYGRDCQNNCGKNCLTETRCDRFNGYCENGCKLGWTGDKCYESCAPGNFGFGCNETCGNCINNETCYVSNGTCPSGCANGWLGQICKTECQNGRYGPYCDGVCSQNCNSVCNKVSGECDTGCIYGWEGIFCDQTCRFQKYGFNCSLTCEKCDQGCHHVSGQCSNQSSSYIPWILTAVLGVTVICLVILVAVMWRRNPGCKHTKNNAGKTAKYEANNENQSDANKERGQDNTSYEELQTRNLERSVYDSLENTSASYVNTRIK